MSIRAWQAIVIRELQRLDWPRTLLALVAFGAGGRVVAGIDPALMPLWTVTAATVASQLSFTRRAPIALDYFAAPLSGRALARAIATVPAAVCATIALAFVAGSQMSIPPVPAAEAVEAGAACALVMQSARLRYGTPLLVYRSIAAACAACIIAANATAGLWAGALIGAAVLALAFRGFAATLARFDPV